MNNVTILEHVPDSYKIGATVVAPALSFMGVPLEQWVYILSAILTILFIIEKLPKAISSIVWMYRKLRGKKDAPGE